MKRHKRADSLFDKTNVTLVLPWLAVPSLLSLSATCKLFRDLVRGADAVWNMRMHLHFGCQDAKEAWYVDEDQIPEHADTPYATFQAYASMRIWRWERVMVDPVWWARLAQFEVADELQENIFACMMYDDGQPELQKGFGRLCFHFPGGFELRFTTADTGKYWQLRKGHESKWSDIGRLDGHHMLPIFRFSEVRKIVEWVVANCEIPFPARYMYPLFSHTVYRTPDMMQHMPEYISRMRLGYEGIVSAEAMEDYVEMLRERRLGVDVGELPEWQCMGPSWEWKQDARGRWFNDGSLCMRKQDNEDQVQLMHSFFQAF